MPCSRARTFFESKGAPATAQATSTPSTTRCCGAPNEMGMARRGPLALGFASSLSLSFRERGGWGGGGGLGSCTEGNRERKRERERERERECEKNGKEGVGGRIGKRAREKASPGVESEARFLAMIGSRRFFSSSPLSLSLSLSASLFPFSSLRAEIFSACLFLASSFTMGVRTPAMLDPEHGCSRVARELARAGRGTELALLLIWRKEQKEGESSPLAPPCFLRWPAGTSLLASLLCGSSRTVSR